MTLILVYKISHFSVTPFIWQGIRVEKVNSHKTFMILVLYINFNHSSDGQAVLYFIVCLCLSSLPVDLSPCHKSFYLIINREAGR